MKLIYGVKDRPKFAQLIVFSLQQLLAIMAATLVVPVVVNSQAGLVANPMSSSAALFGAGIGTLTYLICTKFRSPVFLGSSFAFIGSMVAAFAGAVSAAAGYLGLLIGAAFAALVYVAIALVVKFVGVGWLNKLMPPVVIGPTVAIIGLSLAGNATGDLLKGKAATHPLIAFACGMVTLFTVIICSTYGKKMMKLIPFVIGIGAGYAVAAVFTVIGIVAKVPELEVINFAIFRDSLWANGVNINTFFTVPDFTFLTAVKGFSDITPAYVGTIAVAYVPVAFVVFAEHIADHKNISSIIGSDLLEDPGLDRTLMGDGIGSFTGALFGGCPNTTYGESVACVAITRNASVSSIVGAAVGAIIISFFNPFVALVNSIPSCVMGGVCMALYGFIAVSGLKMLKGIDLGENRNLFVVSTILIAGIGNLVLTFGKIMLTGVAVALILGIIVNLVVSKAKPEDNDGE